MAAPVDLATAAASGSLNLVQSLVAQGADVNFKSSNGFSPLCNAAFWGYSEIVEYLLRHGANVNQSNSGTLWTACHCAAFQGHGKVLMKLMESKPDLTLKDNRGRTAVDFASALETIWPFFAAEGCKRTPKADLIRLNIVQKVKDYDPSIPQTDLAHFSRPGSAYAMRSQSLRGEGNKNKTYAAQLGDVLAEEDETSQAGKPQDPSFNIWRS
ncbi:ankyrin repeat domain-containing protein 49-like [Acanthaster planci]|uniref:Ankyrin repeat domain-containing protein 49-like n=1 Tax=Acanthaster planci TaxID=133434 RepID=A0A8B7ZR46_ACAPL|nr:ankyrin repeat domain-containing protein 49-like [Acanthaster planci]